MSSKHLLVLFLLGAVVLTTAALLSEEADGPKGKGEKPYPGHKPPHHPPEQKPPHGNGLSEETDGYKKPHHGHGHGHKPPTGQETDGYKKPGHGHGHGHKPPTGLN